ncbi:alpha/beta hydrolase [Streptomyces phaeolivaceus]|uniref:Alpha/beta hydrolase n=1 Tax=Streptomyces phaeolivaceus TaxID=2653200 RepID=A0A5P8KEE9_9ACTN|nr:alpha/beta hydrolase [Streptomyces phaeolivaceus]QFR01714.1 alpha/beta hydrolase [Streptomyces phaeolivaceus]
MSDQTNGPTPATDGVRLLDGLVYAETLGFRPLRLDLYLPPATDAGPVPLVVFVHGGGWVRGDRKVLTPTFVEWRPSPFELLAAEGFAVASVDYRLSGEARFPAQLEDLSAAMEWLAGHAEQYGYDADRTVLWGESAGAHLAMLLVLRDDCRVRGLVDWYGPTDLGSVAGVAGAAAALSSDPEDTREARLLGAPASSVPALVRDASPITHVRPGAPPFLVVHGTADTYVPFEQSATLVQALTDAGVDVRFQVVEGADHLWMGLDDPRPVFDSAIDFVREITGPR